MAAAAKRSAGCGAVCPCKDVVLHAQIQIVGHMAAVKDAGKGVIHSGGGDFKEVAPDCDVPTGRRREQAETAVGGDGAPV